MGVVLIVFEALTSPSLSPSRSHTSSTSRGSPSESSRPGLAIAGAIGVVETLLLLTVAIVGIAAVNSAADSLTEVCMARADDRLGTTSGSAMISHLQRLSLSYHDKKRTGDVLTRVTGDVLVVRRVRGGLNQQHPEEPARAIRQPVSYFSTGPGMWHWWPSSSVRCSPSSLTSTPGGSRRRPKPQRRPGGRAGLPTAQRCSPRSGWCKAARSGRPRPSPLKPREHARLIGCSNIRHNSASLSALMELSPFARWCASGCGSSKAARSRLARSFCSSCYCRTCQAGAQDRERVVQDRQGLRKRERIDRPPRP